MEIYICYQSDWEDKYLKIAFELEEDAIKWTDKQNELYCLSEKEEKRLKFLEEKSSLSYQTFGKNFCIKLEENEKQELSILREKEYHSKYFYEKINLISGNKQ